jgi:proline iminopeptidase
VSASVTPTDQGAFHVSIQIEREIVVNLSMRTPWLLFSALITLGGFTYGANAADSMTSVKTPGPAGIGCPSIVPKALSRAKRPDARELNPDGRYRSAGAELFFRRFGHGPIVVVLAGGPGLDAVYLEPVAEAIASLGYQAVLPDLRGTGRSAAAGGDLSMLTVTGSVADVEALRCALSEERLRLVGHSFGGAIALAYAAEHPRHVSHLVALDSVGTDMTPDESYGAAIKHNLTSEEIAEFEHSHQALRFELIAAIVDRQKAEALWKALPSDFAHPEAGRPLDQDYERNYHVASQVKDLNAKVTIIAGIFDPIRVWEPSLITAFPHAPLILLPGASHLPWIDKPLETTVALGRALAP